MNPTVLAFLAALCWGIAPVFGKLGVESLNPLDALAARSLITVVFVAAYTTTTGRFDQIRAVFTGPWEFLALEAFLATLAGDLAYFAALKWGGAGVTAMVLASSPVVTLILSSLLFQERFSGPQIVGGMLVAVGLLLLGLYPTR